MYSHHWSIRNIVLSLLLFVLFLFQVFLGTNITLVNATSATLLNQAESGQRFIFKNQKRKPIRTVLLNFFTAWNPPMVKNIDAIVDKYQNNEDTLLKSIKKIYSVNHFDGKPTELQFNLIQFYMKHEPKNIKNVASILKTYKGKENLLKTT